MPDSFTLGSLARWLSAVGVTAGGLGVFLYGVLKKTLEKTVDSRFDTRLEKVKHELDLETKKQSIVYEQQKESFRKVLVAMHQSISTMGEATKTLQKEALGEAVSAYSRVIAEESLFMDNRSDRCLRLFRDIMQDAVGFQDVGPEPASLRNDFRFYVDVARAYDQMKFISDHLAEHFRAKVGLKSSIQDPLLDVELFEACRLMNKPAIRRCAGLGGWFRPWDDEENSAAVLVARVRENPSSMKSDLAKVRNAILAQTKDGSRSPAMFRVLDDVDWCMSGVESLSSTAAPKTDSRP